MQNTDISQWITIDYSIDACINNFIFDRKAQNMAKGTIFFYEKKLELFGKYCKQNNVNLITDITSTFIKQFLIYLDETGHNAGGVSTFYRSIKSMLIWFEKEVEPEGWKNPIHKVKSPKIPLEIKDPVNIDDIKAMIKICKGDTFTELRDRAIFAFLLDSGVRAAELMAITFKDIDLITGEVIIRLGKGRKTRVVYIGTKTKKYLKIYLKARKDDCNSLWVKRDGEPMTYWGLKSMMKYRADLAGVRTPEVHAFRRWFALTCLKSGMDIYALQDLMGHADLQVLKRYLKITNDDIRTEHKKVSPVDNNL
jgi:site-specific recombinase XerD